MRKRTISGNLLGSGLGIKTRFYANVCFVELRMVEYCRLVQRIIFGKWESLGPVDRAQKSTLITREV